MFKYALALAAIVVVGGVASTSTERIGIAQDEPQSMTVRGQIWDSTCAAASSHGKMMTTTKAKDAKECTLDCVKAGAQLVLYNTDDKTTYRLDTQDKVKEYAGQTVTVIGSYDRSTGVLHVDRVETVM